MKFAVKCHECRQDIRWTDSMRESAEGGTCDSCRAEFAYREGAVLHVDSGEEFPSAPKDEAAV